MKLVCLVGAVAIYSAVLGTFFVPSRIPSRHPKYLAYSAQLVHRTVPSRSRAPVTLLTNNVRDFPQQPLATRGVTVVKPDDFFADLAASRLAELVQIVNEMSTSRRRPPMTITDVLGALERAGLRRFAGLVRAADG